MFFRFGCVLAVVAFSSFSVASAQSFRLNKLKQDYSNQARDSKMALAKLIDSPSNGAKSRWNSKCKDALNSLNKLEDDQLSAEEKKWKSRQAKSWEAVNQIGSEIADTNYDLEEALGEMRKALLQSRQDAKSFIAKCDKALSEDINDVNAFMKRWVDDSEKWNKAFHDLAGDAADGEFSGDQDDQIQQMLVYKKNWDQLRRTVKSSVRLYQSTYEFLYEAKKKQFAACTGDIRIQRRRLERLVSLKMDPNGEKFFGEFEEAIEKAALSRLDIYQELLDDWVEVNQPFQSAFNEFMADAVGPAIVRASKAIPKTVLGYSLPSQFQTPDGTLDWLLDSVGEFLSVAPKFYIQEGEEALEIALLELQEKHEEELEALDIKQQSRIGRATNDSEQDMDDWRRSLKTKSAELQNIERETRLFKLVQDQIQVIVEEMNLEPKSLEKEIAFIKAKIADERSAIVVKHEKKLGVLRQVLKSLK